MDGFAGDVVHVRAIAKTFADLGNEVLLLVGDGSDNTRIPNVTIKVVKKKHTGTARFLDDLRAACVGIRWLRLSPERLIYERRFSCKVGLLIKLFTNAPLGVEINGLVDGEAHAQGEAYRKARVWTLSWADRIIAVAPGLAEALSKRYGLDRDRICVVSNGVDVEHFYPLEKSKYKPQCGFEPIDKIILFIGNFAGWYDLSLLIKAFSIVASSIDDAKLVLIGDGKLMNEVRRQIHESELVDRVVLTGRVDHSRIPDYIAASDVCVAPFTKGVNEDGLSPMKLFEYLAVARPVVASDVGGLDQYASKLPSLHLVEIENPVAFAEKILILLANSKEEDALKSSEVIRNQYSWQQATLQILGSIK